MISNVIGIAPERLICDMKVEIAYEPITDEITLPKFRPVDAHPAPLPDQDRRSS